MTKRVLGKQGYNVLEAGDGEQAIEVFEKHHAPIHLIITDVVMPGINGKELADKLTARCPEIKVLYISGYTDNVIVHHGVLEKGTNFIQKPYTMESITRKVRKVLEKE